MTSHTVAGAANYGMEREPANASARAPRKGVTIGGNAEPLYTAPVLGRRQSARGKKNFARQVEQRKGKTMSFEPDSGMSLAKAKKP